MKTEKNPLKLKCVEIVGSIASKNYLSDAAKLHDYLSAGDPVTKVECINVILSKETRPETVDSLIKETEAVYNFVIESK